MDQEQLQELRELVEFLKLNGVNEFDMERPDLKVRIKFAADPVPAALTAPTTASSFAPPAELAVAAAAPPIPVPIVAPVERLHEVKSPIVGTFYNAPSPGAPPFVGVGDTVHVGQVLCIVEAMKLMNEIEADVAGEIVERIAIGGQPVEYGQPLFTIRPR